MNATEFWGRTPRVITSVRALATAAVSSGKGVIMFIVSYLKILSLVRDAVQKYLVFNLWGASQFYAADSSCTLKSPLPLQPQGMLRSGHLSVRKAKHKPHTLGNWCWVVFLNIVPGVTGRRKYSANSKTTSAVSALFLPTSLFLFCWECHGR